MIILSAPAQTSLVVPMPPAPIIDLVVAMAEDQSKQFQALTPLLSRFVYSVTQDFCVQQLGLVRVSGSANPGASILLTVNGVRQNPGSPIIADQDGLWNTTVKFGPGQNLVQAQYAS